MFPSKNLPMEHSSEAGATINKKKLACPARFERATYALEAGNKAKQQQKQCSKQFWLLTYAPWKSE